MLGKLNQFAARRNILEKYGQNKEIFGPPRPPPPPPGSATVDGYATGDSNLTSGGNYQQPADHLLTGLDHRSRVQ